VQVSIGADGSLVFGETSTWSNEGSCSGSILDDTTTGTYDPNVGAEHGSVEHSSKKGPFSPLCFSIPHVMP